jgi:hypothetical protein
VWDGDLARRHGDAPKFFKVRESPLYGYLSRFDRLETRASPQITHGFKSRRFNTRRVYRFKAHCPQLDADWLQWESAAQYVPGIAATTPPGRTTR